MKCLHCRCPSPPPFLPRIPPTHQPTNPPAHLSGLCPAPSSSPNPIPPYLHPHPTPPRPPSLSPVARRLSHCPPALQCSSGFDRSGSASLPAVDCRNMTLFLSHRSTSLTPPPDPCLQSPPVRWKQKRFRRHNSGASTRRCSVQPGLACWGLADPIFFFSHTKSSRPYRLAGFHGDTASCSFRHLCWNETLYCTVTELHPPSRSASLLFDHPHYNLVQTRTRGYSQHRSSTTQPHPASNPLGTGPIHTWVSTSDV